MTRAPAAGPRPTGGADGRPDLAHPDMPGARTTPLPNPAGSARSSPTGRADPSPDARGPVWSWNEWDPLEEVVVGRVEHSVHPPFARYILGGVPDILYKLMFFVGGRRKWPAALFIEPARRELENLVRVLEIGRASCRERVCPYV